jgi:hypothetical protein
LPLGEVMGGQTEGIEPERLDFHRFADAGGDDPVIDFGVHPGELHTGHAAREQAIGVGPNGEAGAVLVAGENGIDSGEERLLFRRGQGGGLRVLEKFADDDDVPERGIDGVVFGDVAGVGKTMGSMPCETVPDQATRISRAFCQ